MKQFLLLAILLITNGCKDKTKNEQLIGVLKEYRECADPEYKSDINKDDDELNKRTSKIIAACTKQEVAEIITYFKCMLSKCLDGKTMFESEEACESIKSKININTKCSSAFKVD